jgi:hypothetical protein
MWRTWEDEKWAGRKTQSQTGPLLGAVLRRTRADRRCVPRSCGSARASSGAPEIRDVRGRLKSRRTLSVASQMGGRRWVEGRRKRARGVDHGAVHDDLRCAVWVWWAIAMHTCVQYIRPGSAHERRSDVVKRHRAGRRLNDGGFGGRVEMGSRHIVLSQVTAAARLQAIPTQSSATFSYVFYPQLVYHEVTHSMDGTDTGHCRRFIRRWAKAFW